MTQTYIRYFFTVFVFSAVAVSCNKKLDVESSAAAGETQMWNTYDDARAGLNGIYGLARAALANNNAHWMYGELRAGDFAATTPGSYIDAIIKNELNKSFPEIEELTDWRRFYAVIDACNTFIKYSPECLKDLRYSRLNNKVDVAQAHLMRAFIYFYISRIWGDVPLVTKPTTEGVNINLARSPQSQVLDFCIRDVKQYLDSLPTEYGNDDRSKLNYDGPYYGKSWGEIGNTYWGYWQAITLLAHVYAWIGDYASTETYTKLIINNTGQAHIAAIGYANAQAYLTGSTQSIFYDKGVIGGNCYQLLSFPYNMANRESGPSGVGHIESLTLASPYLPKLRPDIFMTRDTIDRLFYSTTDLRHPYDQLKQNYESVFFTDYYGAIPVFSKFKTIAPGATGFSIFGSCIPLSRYEDILLLDGEVEYVKGTSPGTINNRIEAIRLQRFTNGYANNLRPLGSGGPVYVPTPESQENGQLWNIFRERRIELMGEGSNWYDLIRYKKLTGDDARFNKLIEEGGIYWPISQKVIDKNPLIEQNPYWKK